ncbi:MAG TPA: hypothetical protein VLU46_03840 [Thermoanaerobaculia bacterium]|nr:hypothetical protein [Thermoanaerobaculia bacterium]
MPEPLPIEHHAAENLRYIRSAMERAGTFTAVPGWGTVAVGVTAVASSLVAGNDVTSRQWLVTWLSAAAIAAAISAACIILKARATSMALTSAPVRRFALAFLPALFAGLVLTAVLWSRGLRAEVTPMWLLLYGTAITAGGALSVRVVPVMGLAFALLGIGAFFVPLSFLPATMVVGFGLLHIVFGAIIARYYGG